MTKSTADYLRQGFSLAWTRVEPGWYVCGRYEIRREATTFGMKRASNPAWFVYASEVVETYPYGRPDAAMRHALEVGGYRVLVYTSRETAEWQVRVRGLRIGREPTLAKAKGYVERTVRRAG